MLKETAERSKDMEIVSLLILNVLGFGLIGYILKERVKLSEQYDREEY